MNATRRYIASLKLGESVPRIVTRCNTILGKMSTGADYSAPPIPYATVQQHVTDLDKAEQTVRKNGATDRNAKLAIVRADMRQYKAFIQGLADNDLTNAQSLIEGAGMFASARTVRTKEKLAARDGAIPGQVVLDAKAEGRATYYWQMRTGQGAWGDLPPTVHSTTTVDGLTPGTSVEFRLRLLTAAGFGEWISSTPIIVR